MSNGYSLTNLDSPISISIQSVSAKPKSIHIILPTPDNTLENIKVKISEKQEIPIKFPTIQYNEQYNIKSESMLSCCEGCECYECYKCLQDPDKPSTSKDKPCGRDICSCLLWIICAPCKCIIGGEEIDDYFIPSCCPFFDCGLTYLPSEVIQNWFKYKQMLINIQWHNKYEMNMKPNIISQELHYLLYNVIFIVNEKTNNKPLKIQNKKQLIQLLENEEPEFDHIINGLNRYKPQINKQNQFKILLLGSNGSGKTTIFKQLQLIYGKGYGLGQYKSFREQIYTQCINEMKLLLNDTNTTVSKPNDTKSTNWTKVRDRPKTTIDAKLFILKQNHNENTLNNDIVTALKYLWNKDVIKQRYYNKYSINMEDSTAYFWNKLDDLNQSNYTPDDMDISLIKYSSPDCKETKLDIDGNDVHVIDCGGDRYQRRKWLQYFDGTKGVIFVVNLSCYDEIIDSRINAMTEQLDLFKAICCNELLNDIPIILYLNKRDIFDEKIKTIPLQNCPLFSVYDGDPTSSEEAIKYIWKEFIKYTTTSNVFTYITNALDKDNIHRVFDDTRYVINEAMVNQNEQTLLEFPLCDLH